MLGCQTIATTYIRRRAPGPRMELVHPRAGWQPGARWARPEDVQQLTGPLQPPSHARLVKMGQVAGSGYTRVPCGRTGRTRGVAAVATRLACGPRQVRNRNSRVCPLSGSQRERTSRSSQRWFGSCVRGGSGPAAPAQTACTAGPRAIRTRGGLWHIKRCQRLLVTCGLCA